MKEMMNWLKEEESGQGMVEYALILGLVSVVAIAAIVGVGTAVKTRWNSANQALQSTVAP